ncbi:MAG: di-trans,poly-cis-decaprenylcistransferase, partial [bacterium]|nr:di-trans,poly-cis-decaprenylcistransferase [bacterium]
DIPDGPRQELKAAIQRTSTNTGLNLILALSYGGRAELCDAVAVLAKAVASSTILPEDITEDLISAHMYNPDVPDPELIIRTSGEQRLSNFLLWQSAYSEFVFSPVLWPDFHAKQFRESLKEYRSRNRRFGGLE